MHIQFTITLCLAKRKHNNICFDSYVEDYLYILDNPKNVTSICSVMINNKIIKDDKT